MKYVNNPEFEKDLKNLTKKFKTLPEDLENLKKLHINVFHENGINNDSFFKIQGCCNERFESYKIRKIACRALKNKGNQSGLRLIYIFDKKAEEITFIEIYFKSDSKAENRERLKTFLKDNIKLYSS